MRPVLASLSVLFCAVVASAPASAEPLRLKWSHPEAEPGSLRWFADILTGIEITRFGGWASLSSSVRPDVGPAFRLANANVGYGGFSVSLLDAPRKSGVGLTADFGFFRQTARVVGFNESLPQSEGSTDISGVCSFATSGEEFDCNEPNRYDIRLWSAYLGPELFAALVAGNRNVELFALVGAAARVVELRSVAATVGAGSTERVGPALLRSMTSGLTVGFTLPRLHMSARLGLDLEHYFRFRYPEPLEFQGPVDYDQDRDIWLRPRMWVDDASITAVAFSASAGVLF